MVSCQICHKQTAEAYWQPWGPSVDPRTAFEFPGDHYRGFPIIKVCYDCQDQIESGQDLDFSYKKVHYHMTGNEINPQ